MPTLQKLIFLTSILSILLLTVCGATASSITRNLIKLTDKNVIIVRGPIDDTSSAKIINELTSKQRERELYIYIISNGGSVVSGMEIIRTMQALSNNGANIKCIADTAMSMAFVIFQYCPARYVTLSSVLMQHQLQLGVKGPINHVNSYLSFIKNMESEVDGFQANRLNLTTERFRDLTTSDWWLFGNDIIVNKAADELVDVICDYEPKNIQQTITTFFGDINVTYSSCPLATGPLEISFDRNQSAEVKNKIRESLHSYKMNPKVEPI